MTAGSFEEVGEGGDNSTRTCRAAVEFESVDCGRVWGYIVASRVVTTDATDGQCTDVGNGPEICTPCRARLGCLGDKFGVGTQGCKERHHGVLCGLCEKTFFMTAANICSNCPNAETYYITFSAAAAVLIIGANSLIVAADRHRC
eukprot:2441859-Rhodomonas_salina.1